jgi:hypothetical protein
MYAVASSLTEGKEYYARVSASNSAGASAYTTSDQTAGEGVVPFSHIARTVPSAPTVTAAAISASQIEVSYNEPSSYGSDIELYKVEWTTDSDFSGLPRDIRTIRINNTNASDTLGHFTLSYGGAESVALTMSSTPAEIEAALQNLDTVGQVTVSTTGYVISSVDTSTKEFYAWAITFDQDVGVLGDLTIGSSTLYSESTKGTISAVVNSLELSVTEPANYGFDYMYASPSTCGSTSVGSSSSIQKIVLRANDAAVSAGSYQLSLDGEKTACIAWNANADDVANALKALSNVRNGVEVVSTQISAATFGFPNEFTVYFQGEYPNGEWPTLRKVDETFGKSWANHETTCVAFVGGADWSLIVLPIFEESPCSGGVAETQTIVIDGSSTLGGTFDLYYGGEVQKSIAVSSTARQMESIIAQFTGITSVEVTKHAHADKAYGVAWVVKFVSEVEDVDMLVVNDVKVTGTDANANVYPIINITTFSDTGDMSGDFRIHLNGEISEPISYQATQKKMVQALEKLPSVGKVAMIGSTATDDIVFSGDDCFVLDESFDLHKTYNTAYRTTANVKLECTATNGANSITLTQGDNLNLNVADKIIIGNEMFRVKALNIDGVTVDLGTVANEAIAASVTATTASNVVVYQPGGGGVTDFDFGGGTVSFSIVDKTSTIAIGVSISF